MASDKDEAKTGSDWTATEVRLTVADYLDMLRIERAGQPYSKAEHRAELRTRLPARSNGAIEFKHANISAALAEMGLPYIDGYKPRGNYQQALIEELRRQLDVDKELSRALPQSRAAGGTGREDESASVGSPTEFAPGTIEFTYEADAWGTGDTTEHRIRFDWDGGRSAVWTQDISDGEDLSPMSSSPVSGWASWQNGEDLLIAYSSFELELEGWARVPGAAPLRGTEEGADDEEVLADPRRWIELAGIITSVIHEQSLPGMTGDRYK